MLLTAHTPAEILKTVDRLVSNSELEGITVAGDTGHVWVVNEKDPPLLIELNASFEELYRYDLSRYFKDLSGISYASINTIRVISFHVLTRTINGFL